jgi:predicted GNAT family N-acyltransferase
VGGLIEFGGGSETMGSVVEYRYMLEGEESKVSALVLDVFNEFVAPEYSAEGIQEFTNYVEASKLLDRSKDNHFCLVAVVEDKPVGTVEVRNNNHICLFFVAKDCMGQGIAKELMKRALQICWEQNPGLEEVDVNSSSYAVKIYEKLGFDVVGPSQEKNGIIFVPMKIEMKKS